MASAMNSQTAGTVEDGDESDAENFQYLEEQDAPMPARPASARGGRDRYEIIWDDNFVRTYCTCNPQLILCDECYTRHVLGQS